MKFIFQGNGFPFFLLILFFFLCEKYRYLSMGDEVERTSPFQIYYIHLRVGGRGEKTPSFDLFFRLRSRAATTRRCALTSKLVLMHQTPAPCTYYVSAEFRLAVEFGLNHSLLVSPTSTEQSRGFA